MCVLFNPYARIYKFVLVVNKVSLQKISFFFVLALQQAIENYKIWKIPACRQNDDWRWRRDTT